MASMMSSCGAQTGNSVSDLFCDTSFSSDCQADYECNLVVMIDHVVEKNGVGLTSFT